MMHELYTMTHIFEHFYRKNLYMFLIFHIYLIIKI